MNNEATSVAPVSSEDATFTHVLKDNTRVTVGLPKGVIRLKLRNLLGEHYYKDDELKTIGTAFLSIRNWSGGAPSPLMNPTHFDAMIGRFEDDDDLDSFMEKWQELTQPELSAIVKKTLLECMDEGLDQEETRKRITVATLPYAKSKLNKVRDLPVTPSS
jgi:hypothetical protein